MPSSEMSLSHTAASHMSSSQSGISSNERQELPHVPHAWYRRQRGLSQQTPCPIVVDVRGAWWYEEQCIIIICGRGGGGGGHGGARTMITPMLFCIFLVMRRPLYWN